MRKAPAQRSECAWTRVSLRPASAISGDRLDAGGAGVDQGAALALEIDTLCGPAPGEIDFTLKSLNAVDAPAGFGAERHRSHEVMAAQDVAACRSQAASARRARPSSTVFTFWVPKRIVAPQIVASADESRNRRRIPVGRVFLDHFHALSSSGSKV